MSNGCVIAFYEIARFFQKIIGIFQKRTAPEIGMAEKPQGYIENQNAYGHVKFGKTNMQYAGCEIFAVYNALLALGDIPTDRETDSEKSFSLEELIRYFERDGMAFSGRIGTSPMALVKFLRRRGYQVCFSKRESEFSGMMERNSNLILTMYNNGESLVHEIHTVCITKQEGKLVAHNVFCNGKILEAESYEDLITGINQGKAKGIFLIGIK